MRTQSDEGSGSLAHEQARPVHIDGRRSERARLREELEQRYDLNGLVFASDAMLSVLKLTCRVTRSQVPVLITGPSGAGKERIASIVHRNSMVREGPFVAVNCRALPHDLFEAELFGAEAGAYTGATKARRGRFERADGGTLFLDEVCNLPAASQAKLLRAIETGEIERLGASSSHRVKVRLISATNAELPVLIRQGRFREDLYYRLAGIHIELPPLADRPEDILPLAGHFLAGSATLSEDAREALTAARELRNVIERARLLCYDGVIQPADLDLKLPQSGARSLDEPSREAVEAALARAGGIVRRAAQTLGLSRQALYRRMRRFGIAAK